MARSPAMEQNPTLEIDDSAGLSLESDSGDDPEDSEWEQALAVKKHLKEW